MFPSSNKTPYSKNSSADSSKLLMRSEVLEKITTDSDPTLIVTYPNAIYEKIVSHETLRKRSLKIKKTSTQKTPSNDFKKTSDGK